MIKNSQSKKRGKGITITELVVVMGIVAIFSLFLVSLLLISNNAWGSGITSAAVQNNAKQGMEEMLQELREADSDVPGVPIVIGSGNKSITFPVPNVVGATSITNWNSVEFSLNETDRVIERRLNSGTPEVVARDLAPTATALQFSITSNVVTVTVNAEGTTPKGETVTASLTSQAWLRN